jgi:5-formyltetrahydrofolate cyclo-ligase
MGLREDKAALRDRLRAVRDAIPPEEREAAVPKIAERLVMATAGYGTVMGFLAFGSELPTFPLLTRLAQEGHDLVVPHIADGGLTPVAYDSGEPLAEAVWGIPEPARLRPVDPLTIDAVFAPGLGFDRGGFRIGYGGGFYDRLFTRLRADVLRVGVGFHPQVVPEVPHGEGDERLDLILTEVETIRCG